MFSPTWSRQGWRGIACVGVFALCVLSLAPPSALMTEAPRFSDKLYHALGYGSLMWWCALGYARAQWRMLLLALTGLGLGLEYCQGLTEYREASLADGFANFTGAAFGFWCAAHTPTGFPRFRQAE
jgi:VanZ family protein